MSENCETFAVVELVLAKLPKEFEIFRRGLLQRIDLCVKRYSDIDMTWLQDLA